MVVPEGRVAALLLGVGNLALPLPLPVPVPFPLRMGCPAPPPPAPPPSPLRAFIVSAMRAAAHGTRNRTLLAAARWPTK